MRETLKFKAQLYSKPSIHKGFVLKNVKPYIGNRRVLLLFHYDKNKSQ